MPTCRDCFATILFVKLDTGRPIPVDPIPLPDKGNVAASKTPSGKLVGHVISRTKPLQDHQERYMPHHASCKPERPKLYASERTPNLFT